MSQVLPTIYSELGQDYNKRVLLSIVNKVLKSITTQFTSALLSPSQHAHILLGECHIVGVQYQHILLIFTLVRFICLSNNRISRITKMDQSLCTEFSLPLVTTPPSVSERKYPGVTYRPRSNWLIWTSHLDCKNSSAFPVTAYGAAMRDPSGPGDWAETDDFDSALLVPPPRVPWNSQLSASWIIDSPCMRCFLLV